MKYAALALIGILLVAGCVGQGGYTTGTQASAPDTNAVDTELNEIDTATSDLAEPDVDLDATFG